MPWEIENNYLNETALEETIAEQHSGSDVDFDDELEDKFDAMNEANDAADAAATAGQSWEAMLKEIAPTPHAIKCMFGRGLQNFRWEL